MPPRFAPPPLALVLVLGACPDPEPAVDPTEGAHVRDRWDPASADGFWSAPWPSSERRTGGTLPLALFPNPDAIPFVTAMIEAGSELPGDGTTAGIFFPLDAPLDSSSLPDLHGSIEADASVFLIGVEPGGVDLLRRVPVDVRFAPDGGPFGAPNLLSLVPLQGRPLRANETYAAVVTRRVRDIRGELFGASPLLMAEPQRIPPVLGMDPEDLAGITTFRTQDPQEELRLVLSDARVQTAAVGPFVAGDEFPDYCVLDAAVDLPVYQHGEPPYDDGGGTFRFEPGPVLARSETARVVLTLPRGAPPASGWPVVVFARTGGGGDRPLVDRGVHDTDGVAAPGSGYARDFAAAGWAGVQVDGPLGGVRNPTGGDEQFLIFNVLNPGAMRDNIRQSAMELALLPELLDALPSLSCDGAASLDTSRLALFGHSMGATVAPLTLGLTDRYRAAILSGAGGSWIENVIHKESPLEVRPIAEAMLRYPAAGATLTEADPILSLLQYVGESADPPVWAPAIAAHAPAILMFQGIVDSYILPPMANATTLSLGLDVAEPVLDADEPRLNAYAPIASVLDLGAGGVLTPLPSSDRGAVVQIAEDGVEDGHEVAFQTARARELVRCFLQSVAVGTPQVGCPTDP